MDFDKKIKEFSEGILSKADEKLKGIKAFVQRHKKLIIICVIILVAYEWLFKE